MLDFVLHLIMNESLGFIPNGKKLKHVLGKRRKGKKNNIPIKSTYRILVDTKCNEYISFCNGTTRLIISEFCPFTIIIPAIDFLV